MQQHFDIVADLDTPVSAYLKLKPLMPRFLLESVERGKHVGRYSFLGFGKTREFRLDASGRSVNGLKLPAGPDPGRLLDAFRGALQALGECCRSEGILPALESAHALAGAKRLAAEKPGVKILLCLSGRGDKDLDTLMKIADGDFSQ